MFGRSLRQLLLASALFATLPLAAATYTPTMTPVPATPDGQLYGLDPWGPTLYHIDPSDGSVIDSIDLTLPPNYSFNNSHGMAVHPGTGVVYAVMTLNGGDRNRFLCTLDIASGAVTVIARTNLHVSDITFDSAGYLYAHTGDDSDLLHLEYSVYELNLNDGSDQFVMSSNIYGGVGFAFNPSNELFYRLSNNGFYSYNVNGGTVTNIGGPISDNALGLVYNKDGWFFGSDNDGNFYRLHQGGAREEDNAGNYYKSMVIVPAVTFATPVLTPTLTPTPLTLGGRLYHARGNQLHKADPNDGSQISSVALSLPSGVGCGSPEAFDLAVQPGTGKVWGIFNIPCETSRVLGTVDLASGRVVPLSGDHWSDYYLTTIDFAPDGRLFGIAGQSGNYESRLVQIDPVSGDISILSNLQNAILGDDEGGQAIAWNSQGNNLLVVIGDSPRRFLLVNMVNYSTQALDVQGPMSEQSQDLVDLGGGRFLLTSNESQTFHLNINTQTLSPIYQLDDAGFGAVLRPDLTQGTPTYTATPTFTTTPPTDTPTPTYTLTPSQLPTPGTQMWGVYGSWTRYSQLDPEDGSEIDGWGMQGAEALSQGMIGLARHPSTGAVYTTVNFDSDPSIRVLAILDLATGAIQQIGSTGANITGLAFSANGTLWAASGNGGPDSTRRSLWTLDLASGKATYKRSLGEGDGHALAYHPGQDRLYHITDDPHRFEVIHPSTLAKQTIELSESLSAEPMALAYYGAGVFYATDNDDYLYAISDQGAVTTLGCCSDDTINGLIVGPSVTVVTATPTVTPTPLSTPMVLWAVEGDNDSLYKLDPGNGSVLDQVTVSPSYRMKGLAKHPSTGDVYTLLDSGNSQVRSLARLDLASAALTVIGNTGRYLNGLAFSPDGTLWAVEGDSQSEGGLFTLNLATGAPTYKGKALIAGIDGMGFTYDPARGRFVTVVNDEDDDRLRMFLSNPADPSAVPVEEALYVGDPTPHALGIGANGALIGSLNGFLVEYSAAGTVRVLGELPSWNTHGLLLAPDAVITTPTPAPTATLVAGPAGQSLYAVNAYSNQLRWIDASNGSTLGAVAVTVPGYTVGALFGAAFNPADGFLYVVFSPSTPCCEYNRYLARVNPNSGVGVYVGNMSNTGVHSLTADNTGRLFALTGAQGSNPGSIWEVNTTDASLTLIRSLGGYSGEGGGIAYDPTTESLVWAKSSTRFGRYNLLTGVFSESTLSISLNSYARAMVHLAGGSVLLSDGNGDLYQVSANGTVSLRGNMSNGAWGLAWVNAGAFGTPTTSPTFTITPTFTETATASPTAPGTFTETPTATPTATITVSPTRTATRTFNPTRTASPTTTPTLVVVNTPGFVNGSSVLGDELAISTGVSQRGKPLCLAFAGQPSDSKVLLYNSAGQKVSDAAFGSSSSACVATSDFAPGIYYMKIKVTLADGRSKERWQKVAILP